MLAALLHCKFAYELHFYASPQQSMDILGMDVHDTVSSEYFVFLSLSGLCDLNSYQRLCFYVLQISGLASQAKKEKRVLNAALTKIVNYGVPI